MAGNAKQTIMFLVTIISALMSLVILISTSSTRYILTDIKDDIKYNTSCITDMQKDVAENKVEIEKVKTKLESFEL